MYLNKTEAPTRPHISNYNSGIVFLCKCLFVQTSRHADNSTLEQYYHLLHILFQNPWSISTSNWLFMQTLVQSSHSTFYYKAPNARPKNNIIKRPIPPSIPTTPKSTKNHIHPNRQLIILCILSSVIPPYLLVTTLAKSYLSRPAAHSHPCPPSRLTCPPPRKSAQHLAQAAPSVSTLL